MWLSWGRVLRSLCLISSGIHVRYFSLFWFCFVSFYHNIVMSKIICWVCCVFLVTHWAWGMALGTLDTYPCILTSNVTSVKHVLLLPPMENLSFDCFEQLNSFHLCSSYRFSYICCVYIHPSEDKDHVSFIVLSWCANTVNYKLNNCSINTS